MGCTYGSERNRNSLLSTRTGVALATSLNRKYFPCFLDPLLILITTSAAFPAFPPAQRRTIGFCQAPNVKIDRANQLNIYAEMSQAALSKSA
jgi:hypothetical protein